MKKRYKKIKKALISGASSAIAAGVIFMGSGSVALAESRGIAFRDNLSPTGMQMMHEWNSSSIADALGLNKDEIKKQLRSGKTMKQILQEHDIVPSDVQGGLQGRKFNRG